MVTPSQSPAAETPYIPDHELLKCVGRGSYGEVWLARSATGTHRGVKVIRRKTFTHERPFEREFLGLQKFEPISRTHPGLVAVLHVGRNAQSGYFYYVMEVADDAVSGQAIDPANYTPKTLGSELVARGKLSLAESLLLSLGLTAALGHLHRNGLVHRDIKPSNIIFVKGQPKFADIGLVTGIGEAKTFVGTAGYIPPEGPGSPLADIYSLGKVIYEMAMGQAEDRFPELPEGIADDGELPTLMRLNQIILKACDHNPRDRFQSADELHAALTMVAPPATAVARPATPPPAPATPMAGPQLSGTTSRGTARPTPVGSAWRVAILYKANTQPDIQVLMVLQEELGRRGCKVFIDQDLAIGMEWAREIEGRIRNSDAVIVLLSAASVQSEMLAYEVELAHQAAQQQQGQPRLLPVRIQFPERLPEPLAAVLDPLQYFLWQSAGDNELLAREMMRALETSVKPATSEPRLRIESVGGAVPLDSEYYVIRPTDHEFRAAMARRDSIVLVKGARQMGKTSLLARALQQSRHSGARVALTDLQKLNARHLESVESFYLAVGDFLADQLDLSVLPEDVWDERRSPNTNFERYLRREILGKINAHLVWGMDEIDRLFTCKFGSEVFGLFRSWHNERALDPEGPWSRLTLAIAYATEAHLFITDINQSPFNVGTRLTLADFTPDQIADLNVRYGSPLKTPEELAQLQTLLGGQPYLLRRGLNEMAAGQMDFHELMTHADRDEGIFGDHLRRMLVLLAQDAELCEVVRCVLRGQPCPTVSSFYRLRSAGIMAGESPPEVHPRCRIYETYLRRHLLSATTTV